MDGWLPLGPSPWPMASWYREPSRAEARTARRIGSVGQCRSGVWTGIRENPAGSLQKATQTCIVLVLKGIYHYWKYVGFLFRGLKQTEANVAQKRWAAPLLGNPSEVRCPLRTFRRGMFVHIFSISQT